MVCSALIVELDSFAASGRVARNLVIFYQGTISCLPGLLLCDEHSAVAASSDGKKTTRPSAGDLYAVMD